MQLGQKWPVHVCFAHGLPNPPVNGTRHDVQKSLAPLLGAGAVDVDDLVGCAPAAALRDLRDAVGAVGGRGAHVDRALEVGRERERSGESDLRTVGGVVRA